MNHKLFLTLFLLLSLTNSEILKATSSKLVTKITKRAKEEKPIKIREISRVEETEDKEVEVTEDKKVKVTEDKEDEVTEDKKYEVTEDKKDEKNGRKNITSEKTQLKKQDMCIGKVTQMFIPNSIEGEYEAFKLPLNDTNICLGLTDSCCDQSALKGQIELFKKTYQAFYVYGEVENKLENLLMERFKEQPSDDLIMKLDTKKQGEVNVTEINIAAVFAWSLNKANSFTKLRNLIDGMSEYYSGVFCQACDPKSHKYFKFNKSENKGETLKVKKEGYNKVFLLLIDLFKLEQDQARSYRIFQHSKEFMTQFPEQVVFKTDADYLNIIEELKDCQNIPENEEKVENSPKCMLHFQKMPFIYKLAGLQWLKQSYTQIVLFLDKNYEVGKDVRSMMPMFIDEVIFVPGNPKSAISIEQFKPVYDTNEGFSMNETKFNSTIWMVRSFEMGLRVFMGGLLFVLVN